MDDFFGGILIVVVLSVAVFSSCSYGEAAAENNVSKQCNNFSKFSIEDTVYDCKEVKNNPK